MTQLKPNEHAASQASTLAETVAPLLLQKDLDTREQHRLAGALLNATSTMSNLIDDDDTTGSYIETAKYLAGTSILVLTEVIEVGEDGYRLSDVNARLAVAGLLIQTLDIIVAAHALTGGALGDLSDKMHDQLTALLRLVVRLSDPDTFEYGYVPDASVRCGALAMDRASQLLHVIAIAEAKAKQELTTTNLAA